MLNEDEFKNIAIIVEQHIHSKDLDYSSCIELGYASMRFVGAYKKYLSTIAQQSLSGSAEASPKLCLNWHDGDCTYYKNPNCKGNENRCMDK